MTSLKIDPQYAPSTACASQLYTNHSDPRGCFLLSHDKGAPLQSRLCKHYWATFTYTYSPPFRRRPPVAPLLNSAYNTTAQVLDYIVDPANAAWFAASERFYIALCFKGHGSAGSACDNSTAANDWLSLIDDFVAAANAAVAAHGLNVEFILDGDATPTGGPCLAQRWRPWNSTYIPGSDAPGAFESNDPSRVRAMATAAGRAVFICALLFCRQGWDRFAVLNPPVDQWMGVVNASYGKFTDSPFAWQVRRDGQRHTQS